MTLEPGHTILNGDYRISERIGRGAFGVVYRARHSHLDEECAIKVLRRDMDGVGSTEFNRTRNRFRVEASLGRDLLKRDARRIVKVLDFRELDGELYLIMEYMAGRSLADKLKGGALTIGESIRIAYDVAQGMAEMHALDAVHRDIKPSNILFDAQGRAKLGDLGLAQTPADDTFRKDLGSAASPHPGTPAYMSPEQQVSAEYLKPTSDVYALGLVIFEMLTGRSFKNLPPGTSLKKLRPQIPDELDALVMRMLEYDASARPFDGTAVAQQLRQFTLARRKAREEREQAEQQEAQRKALEESQRKEREDRKAKERQEAQRKAQEESQRKEREDRKAKEQLEAQRRTQEEAQRKEREDRKAKEQLEAQRKAQEEAIRRERQRQITDKIRKGLHTLSPWLVGLAVVLAVIITFTQLAGLLNSGTGATAIATTLPRSATIDSSAQASPATPAPPTATAVPTEMPTPVPPTATTAPTATPEPTRPWRESGNELFITLPGEVEMVLVRVEAGPFWMGSSDHDRSANPDDEEPAHEVTLGDYWIGKYEVTNAQYAAYTSARSLSWTMPSEKESHPVVSVSWDDAVAFCNWLSEVSGLTVRLPTEAEWEKAARGPSTSAASARRYPWGDEPPDGSRLNYADMNTNVSWADKTQNDGYELSAPVGSYPNGISNYGAFDMAGNVQEWTADWYGLKYYAMSPTNNPIGPTSGQFRVVRGGSWQNSQPNVRAAVRDKYNPNYGYSICGFRVVSAPIP